MIITDYRVQSVLRTYSKQLQRSKLPDRPSSESERKPSAEKVTISDEARRRLVMERMTSQVLGNAYPRRDGGGEELPVE